MQKVLVIVGPTASGKSALAVQLAKKLNGEIISADSRQVYKNLNIGTGKITRREMKGVKHHLLNVVSSKNVFTASDFLRHAKTAVTEIEMEGKLPIICGGTGFYIDALLGRIELPEVPPNKALRKKLEKVTAAQLFQMLRKTDPKRVKSMNESDRQNPVRLIRALEIAATKNIAQSQGSTSRKFARSNLAIKYDAQWIGIAPNPDLLSKKIHARLLARMKSGMVKEAVELHRSGVSWKRMEELGLEYRFLALYLQKKLSREAMYKELEIKINQYAKRQMTYWRRNKEIQWFTTAEEAYGAITGKQ